MDNILHIEKNLWDAAKELRSGSEITADQYVNPVLCIIFLKYAQIRFVNAQKEIETEIADLHSDWTDRQKRSYRQSADTFAAHNAIMLPDTAMLNVISKETDDNIHEALKTAVTEIESLKPELQGILPKEEFMKIPANILKQLIDKFNSVELENINEDFIGRIYEYFVNEFAKEGAQESGMFFTPKSLVEVISLIIEPDHGTILDPACGSGGMFLQAAKHCKKHGIKFQEKCSVFGQELKTTTANLCKMNLAVHSINGNIKSGINASTYYNDAHNLLGKCDFVMANPPFNDDISNINDLQSERLPFGVPASGGKIGNYLWLQFFYSFLGEQGRAGFVLASSATTAGETKSKGKEPKESWELSVRRQLIQSQNVDVIISVPGNFFYTVALPCTLWFYDKDKKDEIKDKILFIESGGYYTQVSRNLNEWSQWQRRNIAAIVYLYRGEVDKYQQLISEYVEDVKSKFPELIFKYTLPGEYTHHSLLTAVDIKSKLEKAVSATDVLETLPMFAQYAETIKTECKQYLEYIASADKKERKGIAEQFSTLNGIDKKFNEIKKTVNTALEECSEKIQSQINTISSLEWLYSKFKDGVYSDVPGICRIADLKEVEEKNFSLSPGGYVGIEEKIDEDEIPFKERLLQISEELNALNSQGAELMKRINENMKKILG